MIPFMVCMFATASFRDQSSRADAARALIDTVESLQQPIEDFRCEYEGAAHFKGNSAKLQKLGEEGVFESFSGVFIWKSGGETYSDSLHRRATDNKIWHEILVMRPRQNHAELYHRLNDAPLGYAVIKRPEEVNSWDPGRLGWIFLIDKIKRLLAANETIELSVHDNEIDGRPLKVLDVALKLKDIPSMLIFRYWIDLRRNGHVVRAEGFLDGKTIASRLDIKLAPFKVGNAEVWMPVFGETVGYADIENRKPVIAKEPTRIDTIYVVDGTMEFNKHPGAEVFTVKYKAGTPISDHLRKLTTEFGQQRIDVKPTTAEAQRQLTEQIVKAEEQKSELVVAPASQVFDWSAWMIGGFVTLVIVSLALLAIQRRRH